MLNNITFKLANKKDESTIFSWLAEPHMIEFWDNSQEHKDDISNFVHGRKQYYFSGTTKYFIGLCDDVPFAFILADAMSKNTDVERDRDDIISKHGNTIALDFGIGNKDYLGCGLAAKTLEEFMLYYNKFIDNKAYTFFIDPDENNPRAKHVYKKAGFKQVGEYVPTKGAFVGKTNLSMLKKIPLSHIITPELAKKLITIQFPEYANLHIEDVKQQGHDNRTYRLGDDLLIRMPTAESYSLKVAIEQELLPGLAKHLSVNIPVPVKMGKPSDDFPYPFSIYKWLDGDSANFLDLSDIELEVIALRLARFLKELQEIKGAEGLVPGQHNYWRGEHVSVYDKGAREQIDTLKDIIDSNSALELWERACSTRWKSEPVWIHGDLAVGNILIKDRNLSGIIDFGGMAVGDPACDLVIAWTYLSGKSREIFIQELDLDDNTWLRAKAWTLWKATYELRNIEDENSSAALLQKEIINSVINN